MQKIAALVNRSRINEKSQLKVNNRQQLNDSEVTRSTRDNFKAGLMNVVLHEFGTVNHTDIICEIDFECEQERYKQRLIMKFAPTTLQSGESRTLCGKHNIYIFSKKVAKLIPKLCEGDGLLMHFCCLRCG